MSLNVCIKTSPQFNQAENFKLQRSVQSINLRLTKFMATTIFLVVIELMKILRARFFQRCFEIKV